MAYAIVNNKSLRLISIKGVTDNGAVTTIRFLPGFNKMNLDDAKSLRLNDDKKMNKFFKQYSEKGVLSICNADNIDCKKLLNAKVTKSKTTVHKEKSEKRSKQEF